MPAPPACGSSKPRTSKTSRTLRCVFDSDVQCLGAPRSVEHKGERHGFTGEPGRYRDVELVEPDAPWRESLIRYVGLCLTKQDLQRSGKRVVLRHDPSRCNIRRDW